MLVLGSVLVVIAIAAVIAAPKIIHRRPPPPDPALALAAAARDEAAIWIRRWVAPGAVVGCDPLMCSVLLKHDVHSGQLLPLTATVADPLGSSVVVATPVLRSQLGTRLITVYAPDVLASFGAGSARVDIRVVASDGSAAYQHALEADWRARKAAGIQLLSNREISAAPSARRQLADGDVDSRLLIILPVLVHFCGRLRLLRFGGAGPARSEGMPLLAAYVSPGGPGSAGVVAKIVSFLKAQWTFITATISVQRAGTSGQEIVQLDVTAPPQLNAFDGGY
jgi:hypothetical protein